MFFCVTRDQQMIEKGWFDQQMIDKNVINNWPTNNQQIIDKKVIAESMAIAKLLAEDCGLAGKAWIIENNRLIRLRASWSCRVQQYCKGESTWGEICDESFYEMVWKVALALNGLLDNISKFFWAAEETKAALKKEFCEKTLPLKFSQLEVRLIWLSYYYQIIIFNSLSFILSSPSSW